MKRVHYFLLGLWFWGLTAFWAYGVYKTPDVIPDSAIAFGIIAAISIALVVCTFLAAAVALWYHALKD